MFDYLKGRRVLLTGHTGFCGSWLSLWLQRIGADVYGLSKAPYTTPNMHDMMGGWSNDRSFIGDIAEPGVVARAFDAAQPDFVFHLAAQALVRQSYRDTLETYRSNVIGTAEVMEGVRQSGSVRAVILVTTDKVYHNNEWIHPYRETDRLGGKDPYSASKAACELVIQSYIDTVLDSDVTLCASARGGNIIGGGDWSDDRLIPDLVRAIASEAPVVIRNPAATRPWQHVLALCHGYLRLGEALNTGDKSLSGGWNFGPLDDVGRSVMDIADAFGRHWVKPPVDIQGSTLHEAQRLTLDSSKARGLLNWTPGWDTDEGVAQTVRWYRAHETGEDMRAFSEAQLDAYIGAISP